jgi:hypothetical protein
MSEPSTAMVVSVPQARTQLDDFFELSGLLTAKSLKHTPWLAFRPQEGGVRVEIVPAAEELLGWPDETVVMAQWPGQWRSDWFVMTVGDVRQALTKTTQHR